jgi:prepilin-type N-terminal cleavage/methylation domain-containing protein
MKHAPSYPSPSFVSFGSPGFALIELLIATAIMATVGCAFVSLILSAQAIARTQPEAADQQQRARMAVQALSADVARAGAGLDRGANAGPLGRYLPPLEVAPDGSLTIRYVSSRSAQAILAAGLPRGETAVVVDAGSGFTAGTSALVFDATGCHDLVRVTDVAETLLVITATPRMCAYGPGAAIAQAEARTYRVDPAARQLQRRDDATGSTLPMLDGVSRMQVEVLDGARRVRISLEMAPGTSRGVRELAVAFDVVVPNSWLS